MAPWKYLQALGNKPQDKKPTNICLSGKLLICWQCETFRSDLFFKKLQPCGDISELKRPPRCDPVWAGLTRSHLVWLSLGQPGVSLVPVLTSTWVTWTSTQSVVVMQSAQWFVWVACWDDFISQANHSKEKGLMFRSNQWQPEVLTVTALWLFYFVNCIVSSQGLAEF